MQNHYGVLGVGKGADRDKIKKAYRRVAKKHHPDVNPGQESGRRFQEITEAYETLCDEEKRREYDRELEREGSSVRIRREPETVNRGRSPLHPGQDLFSTLSDALFERFLPGSSGPGMVGNREGDLYFEAILSPEEAARGGVYPITLPVPEPCPECAQTGPVAALFCPVCDGHGTVYGEREISLRIPPNIKTGTRIRLSLEEIGLRDACLILMVYIDQGL
ncbi:MAG: DnaJ domain-containing protein [Deltaproteobacteria bacterium]|nr:DnaJ domain-containing protein [Deltaproteobacteria bacterium]MBW2048442.1 DnaJ domain-containing protein [Deltaproteobacteria bacterium]MBW2111250.1 DnaJ domain-containing protein [Deltaproteobacteria bacterium]MBW2353119.1 DnaJ domain-containing protein [Deltaproteobacteria bacterium]HDZ90754.1 hypothetical protein [Deltaproteobacteria bacterium]